MDALLERIALAKDNNSELECLMSDYIPFIKKTVRDTGNTGIDYDDRISLAMLCFMNCVKQYEAGRGSFIAFAASCIRNRLIDENRKEQRYANNVMPFSQDGSEFAAESTENTVSIAIYQKEQEQRKLSDEINCFSAKLGEYGISFIDLPLLCPKQKRSREQCQAIGRYVAENKVMREMFLKTRRLAQSELAREFGLSEKTIEKHRRYIVTMVCLLTGDYPLIRVFLPHYKVVKK